MRIIILLFLIISFKTLSQEKRLALVIGNANYDKGRLENPVNDALLMRTTLEKLNFDVILDTNITTIVEFNEVVRKFGEKRDQYNVGFIYYAGHGVQINDVNYLLATKEAYLSEFDVEDKALSVQKIMRYLTSRTDEVNVLILDACRDNPFEQNWNPKARSTEGGRGLAKITAPTGSLIAYSTDAGNTAADGDGKNSIYCLSLTKNIMIENVSLDQVFRNVRSEVLETSSGRQRPVEASQLTGDAFYLKKSTYLAQIDEIDSLIDRSIYDLAREKTSAILTLDPNNKKALLRKGRIEYNTIGSAYKGNEILKAATLYSNDPEVHEYLARFYSTVGENDKAIDAINIAISLDSSNAQLFDWKAQILQDANQMFQVLDCYNKAILLDPKNGSHYQNRAIFLTVQEEDYENALKDLNKAIELDQNNTSLWKNRGELYQDYIINNKKALDDFQHVLQIDPNDIDAINSIGIIYKVQDQLDLAIAQYEKGIALEKSYPESAAYCYNNRAEIYAEQGKLNEALADYSKAIELDPNNPERHTNRGNFYRDYEQDFNSALIDFSKAIDLDPNNIDYCYNRGDLYYNNIKNNKKALDDFQQILQIDPSDIDAINAIGVIYEGQDQLDLAIAQYEKGINLEKSNPESAAFCYGNRAAIYSEQSKLDKALADYSKAIELDPSNPERYTNRGIFYQGYKLDFNLALIDYSKAIDLDPNNINHWYNRGILYSDAIKNNKKALDDFQQVLQIDPSDIDAINWIGIIYKGQGQLDLALLQYENGITLEKSNPESASYCYNNRAVIYTEQGRLDEALADYSKAIELDQNNPERHANRGHFYRDYEQDFNSALIDFSKAIELDQNNINHWYNRGNLYQNNIKNNKKALDDFQQVLQIDPSDIDAINAIGVIYEEQDQLDLAIAQYEKGINLEKSNPESAAICYINRAVIYAEQGRLDEALADYSKAIELDPNNPERHTNRGYFYRDYEQDFNSALIDFSKAIDLDPNNIGYCYNRGDLYYNNIKNNKKALDDFQQILQIDPSDIDAINAIGVIYEEQDQLDLAIAQYENGITLEKSNPESASYCYNNRAAIYSEQGKLDKALADLSKAIELDPNNPDRYTNRGYFYEDYEQDFNSALIDYSKAIELDQNNINHWYNRGNLYQNNIKNNKKALDDFHKALALDSTNKDVFIALGSTYELERNLDSALHYYERGLKLSTNDNEYLAEFKSYKGDVYAEQGKLDLALNEFNESININPLNATGYDNRGQFYELYLNELTLALKDYSKAIDLNPEEAYYFLARSRVFYQTSDAKSQMKDLDQAIKLDPETQEYKCERALFLGIYGEFDKAIKEIDEAYLIDTTNTDVLLYKSKILVKNGDNEGAIKELDKVIMKTPKDPEAYFIKAKIFESQGKNIIASNNYSKAKTKLVGDYYMTDDNGVMLEMSEIHAHIGKFYEKIGEKELMCEEYQEAAELLKNESRYNFQELKIEMTNKVKLCESK